MQAVSGAGYPGVPSLDIMDNVLPYIEGEEQKIETEPLKLLGTLLNDQVMPADITIGASCNRVGVREGHLETVVMEFVRPPSVVEVIDALENFRGVPQQLQLPSAPLRPIVFRSEPDRPQPALDRYEQNGMAVVVGRVMKSPVLDLKLTLLVHNTIRGAAGAGILNAELLKSQGLL
jgi:aspartate-semialdehyde dehydrogenase